MYIAPPLNFNASQTSCWAVWPLKEKLAPLRTHTLCPHMPPHFLDLNKICPPPASDSFSISPAQKHLDLLLVASSCCEALSRSHRKIGSQGILQVSRVLRGEAGTPVATKCGFKGPNACIFRKCVAQPHVCLSDCRKLECCPCCTYVGRDSIDIG